MVLQLAKPGARGSRASGRRQSGGGQKIVRGSGGVADTVPRGGRLPFVGFDKNSDAETDSVRSPRKSFRVTAGHDSAAPARSSFDGTAPLAEEAEEGTDMGPMSVGSVPGTGE